MRPLHSQKYKCVIIHWVVIGDMPASMQMTELPKNTNTMNSRMRVEGSVICPSKSTPTEHRI